jgi:hypothetical protein
MDALDIVHPQCWLKPKVEKKFNVRLAIIKEAHNSQVLFNMYFLSLIYVFSLDVFNNVLEKNV